MEKGTVVLIKLVSLLLLTISGRLGQSFCHAAAAAGEEGFNCDDASYDLFLCSKYILGGGFRMFEYCCSGLKSLKYNDTTNAYLVNTCDCMKPEFANYTRADEKRATSIENLCNLKLPFPFARNVNCSSVNSTLTNSSSTEDCPSVVGGGGVGLPVQLMPLFFFYFVVLIIIVTN